MEAWKAIPPLFACSAPTVYWNGYSERSDIFKTSKFIWSLNEVRVLKSSTIITVVRIVRSIVVHNFYVPLGGHLYARARIFYELGICRKLPTKHV